MAIMPDGPAGRGHRPSAAGPLVVVDPAVPVDVDMMPAGPGGAACVPVVVLPGGVRVCVDRSGGDAVAAQWWEDLAAAALGTSMYYRFPGGPAR